MRGQRVLLPLILILFVLPLAFNFIPANAAPQQEDSLPPNIDKQKLVEEFRASPANQTVTYSPQSLAPVNPSSPYSCFAGKALCLDITGPSSFFNELPNSETTTHYVFTNFGIYFWYNSLGSNLTLPILTAEFGTLPIPRLPNSVAINHNSTAVWYAYGFNYGSNTGTITVTLKEKEAFGYLLQDLKQTLTHSFSSYPATITETFLNPLNLVRQTTATSLTFGRAGYDWKDSPSAVFNSATNSLSWVVNSAGIIDPTTIGTTTGASSIRFPYQSKTCFANTRYWVFYHDGTNIVFRSSTDGTTWSSATNYDTTSVP